MRKKLCMIFLSIFLSCSSKLTHAQHSNNMLIGVADIYNGANNASEILGRSVCINPLIPEDKYYDKIFTAVRLNLSAQTETGDFINPNKIQTLDDEQIALFCMENGNFATLNKPFNSKKTLMLGVSGEDDSEPCWCPNS